MMFSGYIFIFVCLVLNFCNVKSDDVIVKGSCFEENGGCEHYCIEEQTIGHYCACRHGYMSIASNHCSECHTPLDLAFMLHQYNDVQGDSSLLKKNFIMSLLSNFSITEQDLNIDLVTDYDDLSQPFFISKSEFGIKLTEMVATVDQRPLSIRVKKLRERYTAQKRVRYWEPNVAVLLIEHSYGFIVPEVANSPVLDDLELVLTQASLTEASGIPLIIVEVRNGPARNDMLSFMDATTDVSSWWGLTDVMGLDEIVPQVQHSLSYYLGKTCLKTQTFCTGTEFHGRQCLCKTPSASFPLNGTRCRAGGTLTKKTQYFTRSTADSLIVVIFILISVNIVLFYKIFLFLRREKRNRPPKQLN